jgi:ABC-2 type transport system permease protein
MGIGLMIIALVKIGWVFSLLHTVTFVVLFICGLAMAYSFMILMTSMSVWMVRNQSLYELWWLVMSLMRYPRAIFAKSWFEPFSIFFTFIIPIMLVVNVPAESMVKLFDPALALFTVAATAATIWASRRVFRAALLRYRSASS